jgi:hypothetical protein
LAKLFAVDDLPGTAEKNRKGAERHLLDPYLDAVLAKFARAQVGLKYTEANLSRR